MHEPLNMKPMSKRPMTIIRAHPGTSRIFSSLKSKTETKTKHHSSKDQGEQVAAFVSIRLKVFRVSEALLLAEASACTGSGMAYFSSIKACRSVNCFEKIELRGEGTYGQVS